MKEYVLVSRNDDSTKFIQEDDGNKVTINRELIINRLKSKSCEYYILNKKTDKLNKVTLKDDELKCGRGNLINKLPKT